MKQKTRSEIALEDTWDLTTIYKNEHDFLLEYQKLEQSLDNLLKYKGRLLESGKTLLEFLELSDNYERKLYKLYYYAHLSFDADTTNDKARELTGMVSNLMITYSSLLS